MGQSDVDLYRELLTYADEVRKFTKNVEIYPGQFSFSDFNKECNEKMYMPGSQTIRARKEFFDDMQKLKSECASCWKFYLNPRNKSMRILDIQLGKKFQTIFSSFLNAKLPNGQKCVPADERDKRYPDLKVVKDGKVVAYIELKYQSAPLVFAYRFEKGRECYEGSAALDVKKLQQQWAIKEAGGLTAPIFYVFWLDFPCIKGIFYISLEDMWAFFDSNAAVFQRKVREGDFSETSKGKKLSAEINKIHPSINIMHSFSDFIKFFGC